MTSENQHRLLKRQLKKYKVDHSDLEKYAGLFSAVNEAYKSFDTDVSHLENVLSVSSRELFIANQSLKEENISKSKEALVLSEKLDNVMDNVRDIIFEMDANGNFTYLNSAWEKYGEEPPEETIGKNYMAFANRIKYFDKQAMVKIAERDFSNFNTVFSRSNAGGELLWWDMSVKLLTTSEGNIKGAIGSLVDVTSLKETQQQLIKASEAKGRFLSTMSHEIRTPLNAVIAISNILLMQEPKESQMENLHTLRFSSKHLLNLINDILDYNKMLSGKLNFAEAPFNLRYTIDGIISAFAFSAQDKDIRLLTDIKPCVPDGAVGDHTRLSQVLSNLIGNAIKFTDEGQVLLTVVCTGRSEGMFGLRFTVEDTGIGIQKDKLEYIFERFTQAEDDTSLEYGGTGLGLAISKKILNQLGTDIQVESEVNNGTKFWFDVEYKEVVKASLLEIDTKVERQLSLDGVRLLVVDDNEMNLLVIQQFFDKWNIEYQEARNGKEAIAKIEEDDFDLVLMDLRMPVMDGYTAVRKIREKGGRYMQLPIIALSASVSTDVIEKVTEVGMDDYLCKPFDPVDLFAKISLYATHYKPNKQLS